MIRSTIAYGYSSAPKHLAFPLLCIPSLRCLATTLISCSLTTLYYDNKYMQNDSDSILSFAFLGINLTIDH